MKQTYYKKFLKECAANREKMAKLREKGKTDVEIGKIMGGMSKQSVHNALGPKKVRRKKDATDTGKSDGDGVPST